MVAKAREAKAARVLERSRSKLRRDFADSQILDALASAARVRLAPWGEPITNGAIEKFLKALGVPLQDYLDWDGDTRLGQFAERNPTWPLRALQGLILEQWRWAPAA